MSFGKIGRFYELKTNDDNVTVDVTSYLVKKYVLLRIVLNSPHICYRKMAVIYSGERVTAASVSRA